MMQKHNYFCTNLNKTHERVLGRQESANVVLQGVLSTQGPATALGVEVGKALFSQPEATLDAMSFGVYPLIKNVCFAVNSPRELRQITLL